MTHVLSRRCDGKSFQVASEFSDSVRIGSWWCAWTGGWASGPLGVYTCERGFYRRHAGRLWLLPVQQGQQRHRSTRRIRIRRL